MAFSNETTKNAWIRARGRCENCSKVLQFGRRGNQWHAHHKHSVNAGGKDYLSNCEILCISCHKKTYTYGG